MGSIIALPNDYVVVDLETTGLDYKWDDIIEIAAIRFRDGLEVDRFEQLIAVDYPLPSFITDLTGITDEMLIGCPTIDKAIKEFDTFLGDDIIIGHNVNFDVHFLSETYTEYLGKDLVNQFVDTMRISRKVNTDLSHHRLKDLATHYQISYEGAHRSGVDCDITNLCYRNMRDAILSHETEADFQRRFNCNYSQKLHNIQATTDHFDPDHPLYHKTVVFTGALSQMSRAEAMQLVLNCGGLCGNGVTKNTNYLVIGTSDFISVTEGKKTSKMLKVEQLRAQGCDISTISENTFFDMLGLFSILPNEEDVFNTLKDSLSAVISKNSVSHDKLIVKKGKAYSSIWYGTQMAFRLCCRNDHHYFGVSNAYIGFASDEIAQRITSDGRSDGFTNYEFMPTHDGIMLFSTFLSSTLDAAIDALPKEFDCCSRFEECSDAMHCTNPNPNIATGCGYRKIMKTGRIFCGKNRNIL